MKSDRSQQCAYFPVKLETPRGTEWETVLGWELTDLLVAGLIMPQAIFSPSANAGENEADLFSFLSRNRSEFAHAVSKWSTCVLLELHRTVLPNLEHRFSGVIHHYLLLRCCAKTRAHSTELALQYFTTMQGLLNSCFPEAEFSAIRDRDHLGALCRPFAPNRAAVISHHLQAVDLAKPLVRNTSGFNAPQGDSIVTTPMVHYTYPWVASRDSQERLIRFLLWQTHPVWLVVRMRASEHIDLEKQRLIRMIDECEEYASGSVASKTVHYHQIKLLQEYAFRRLASLDYGGLRLAVLIFTPEQADPALLTLAGDSITDAPARNGAQSLLQGGFEVADAEPAKAVDPWWFPDEQVYTPEEAACAFRLPSPPHNELPGMPLKRFRSAFVNIDDQNTDGEGTVLLGVNVHRGIRQPVSIRVQDRMRHTYILGATGVGKSVFMGNLFLQDVRKGFGACLVDPHGGLIESILGKIPAEREEDVIVLDPLDTGFPLGFNLLEWKTIEERDRIIDDFYQAVAQMYDMQRTGGPMFENNFRNMLKLQMGDKPRDEYKPTLLEFPSLYLHENFRRWLISTTDDLQVRDFLEELENTGGEASLQNMAPYITSKVGRFINDTLLRRMVGQEHTSFDFREIMDKGRILLINLGKGRFGPFVGGLLASQIVSRFKNAAMDRASIPEQQRRPFFLYVDEFQNLPQDEFIELLAEARKYKLGLILANQFSSQLNSPNGQPQNALQAILGNVGTFVMFRLGIEDARQLSPIFHPTFAEQDLKELPNWHAYVQLRIDGKVLPPFNIETVLDDSPGDAGRIERIRDLSRKKYGRPAHEVDAQIHARRRFFEGTGAETSQVEKRPKRYGGC